MFVRKRLLFPVQAAQNGPPSHALQIPRDLWVVPVTHPGINPIVMAQTDTRRARCAAL